MKLTWMLLLFPVVSFAYKVETHMNMTTSAMIQSSLAQQQVLTSLGLEESLTGESQKFLDYKGESKTIKDLMRLGSEYEDDEFPTARSLRHFFDPISYRGLISAGISQTSSPDWILEDTGDDNDQHYSYKDAYEFLYNAITEPANTDRQQNFGLLFQSLGHVIHHVQDMAQPQHVRNDAHCDGLPWGPVCFIIGEYDPSHYEEYSNDKFQKGDAGISGLAPYPLPAFATAREYWTTLDDKGLADFTNYNFVSKDTNFNQDANGTLMTTAYTNPQPIRKVPHNIADANVMGADGQALCTKLKNTPGVTFAPGNCFIEFVETSVTDANTGTTTTNDRASSYSVFNKYIEDYQLVVGIPGESEARALFTLNPLNYDAAHNYLIPRAVAYSAGLINHFFRGKLQISLPDAGVYGFVDQSTVTGIDAETGFLGFNKIKLKVANITPALPGETTPEAMDNGTLEAVLKFHRNTCWQDNLYGYPPAVTIAVTTDGSQCRSAQEEIVVSDNQINITGSNALTSQTQEFIFNFVERALPLNAIDVYLQVVYKGQLGSENNVVVVGTKDISEPSFATILNSSDYLVTVFIPPYKAFKTNQLGHAQLSDVLTDMSLPVAPNTANCIGGTSTSLTWTGGNNTPPASREVRCIPDGEPNTQMFDKYTLNKSSPSPIQITLDALPQKRHATLAFLTDTDAEVLLENTGLTEYVYDPQNPSTVYDSFYYPHLFCGWNSAACSLKISQLQFNPANSVPLTEFGLARGTIASGNGVYSTGPVLNVFYTDARYLDGSNYLYMPVYPEYTLAGVYNNVNPQMEVINAPVPYPVTIEGW